MVVTCTVSRVTGCDADAESGAGTASLLVALADGDEDAVVSAEWAQQDGRMAVQEIAAIAREIGLSFITQGTVTDVDVML